jgi:hypothetical protein
LPPEEMREQEGEQHPDPRRDEGGSLDGFTIKPCRHAGAPYYYCRSNAKEPELPLLQVTLP